MINMKHPKTKLAALITGIIIMILFIGALPRADGAELTVIIDRKLTEKEIEVRDKFKREGKLEMSEVGDFVSAINKSIIGKIIKIDGKLTADKLIK